MRSRADDHYTTLGVPDTATPGEIKRAYRALTRQVHPDTATGDTERMVAVNLAAEVLLDADQRAAYDAARRNSRSSNKVRRKPARKKRQRVRGRRSRGTSIRLRVETYSWDPVESVIEEMNAAIARSDQFMAFLWWAAGVSSALNKRRERGRRSSKTPRARRRTRSRSSRSGVA